MDSPARNAVEFEEYLDKRLIDGEWLFLLVTDLSKCSDTGRRRLASSLREEALDILEATGGHPRLIQETLRCRAKGRPREACIRNLANSKQIESQFVALTRDSRDAQRIADWLGQKNDLGPYRGWILDPLLRRLYWRNPELLT